MVQVLQSKQGEGQLTKLSCPESSTQETTSHTPRVRETVLPRDAREEEGEGGHTHLRCVVRPDTREAPVARFVVLPQPGLARDEAAQAEGREAAEQLQEAAFAAHVRPGPHGQPAARVRPRQRLVVQGIEL